MQVNIEVTDNRLTLGTKERNMRCFILFQVSQKKVQT